MATTPTAAPARRHARQDSNGSNPTLRPQASSPTLTNPDMILPDYDDREPLPPSLQHHHQQSLGWGGVPLNDDMFDFADVVDSSSASPAYPLNTPIIYGNGTMLSDIGEVTEVESNVGGPTRQLSARSRRSNHSDDNLAAATHKQLLRRAPGAGANAKDNRASIDSAHTIPAHHDGAFADFDDTVSVDDSNFQGDDEESVASSFFDGHSRPRNGLASKRSDLSLNQDRYSTSSISRRAEQILANAKRRLTTMEGNLTRARTFSYSSVSDGSTPSPIRTPKSPGFRTPVHARNGSENSIATANQNGMPPRSASALGAAGGYRQPLPHSRSADSINRLNHGISQHPLDLALEPLSEDDGTQDDDNSDSTQVARYASPTFNGYNDVGIARSTSAAQMRGIQDQMNGLKGKIFSLREQAAADSMKRRSLQSLRTQSLFTNARVEDGDEDSKSAQGQDVASPALGSPFRAEFAKAHSGDDELPPPQNEQQTPPWKRSEREPVVARHSPMQNLHQAYLQDENTPPKGKAAAAKEKFDRLEKSGYADEDDDLDTENGDAEDPAEEPAEDPAEENTVADLEADDVSESGDSLYHEAYQHPLSHEDREDAFDYEHFFLHSAMGHVSRQSYRAPEEDDSGSDCSDGSVETTRALPTAASGRPRRPSLDTMTSVDSFATAREGRDSRASTIDTVDDGYESPIIGVTQIHSQTNKRLAPSTQESGSSSEDSRSSKERYGPRHAFQFRPAAMAANTIGHPKRIGLHRPSVSSFESTGTNRSFPLIHKTRLSGNTTPRESPELMMRGMRSLPQSRRSSMNETVLARMSNGSMSGSVNGSLNGSANGSITGSVGGPVNGSAHGHSSSMNGGDVNGSRNVAVSSPTMQPLSGEDQVSVDLLLASIQKCALGLRDTTPSGIKMHDAYRRRLEAARQILDGAPDSF
ncbi:hypothetical protein ISF_03716 [Cordyceps fumosorosea ARSEF 2679]|uniref:Uncharacterized protein n=1 Tax=Cordyceps fumosorosea (strain ARSEF 2679) TaxID=1081104 RepID=A0A167ZHY2_CORFA|nr:hypothetical protein ISF_03716 [Cordyceps fumosorosea ARSEF 2679]OAA67540.1 hypothetical protein ISF_03716 [Cordyceps fumosorosea ARSEF 2679]